MAGESLIIGNGNWGVKSGNLLGYNLNEAKYVPRELTFTRATTGTRTNGALLVEQVPYNLVQYSEEFENVAWVKSNATISSNTSLAPNGTLTADTLNVGVDASSGRHRLYSNSLLSQTVGTTYTATFYLKAAQHQWIQIIGNIGGYSLNVWANFDILNGVIGNTGGVEATATIENVGNGWYRCSLSGVAIGVSTTGFEILLTNNTNGGRYPSYQSLVAENVCYIWGGQIVADSLPLDYLPTTTRLNIPRIDYSTGTAALLMEPQRTNIFTNSEDFSGWNKLQTTVVVNTTTSPSGILTADSLLETAVVNQHIAFTDTIALSGTQYTFSVYVKSIGGRNVQILGSSGFSGSVMVDLSNGNILSGSGVVSNVGNGWFRISITATTTTTIIRTIIYIVDGATTSYTGDVTKGVSLWGAQVEAGAYLTSYIPTTSASVTRNNDSLVQSGISNFIGQAEGTIYIDVTMNSTLNTDLILIGNSTGVFYDIYIYTGSNKITAAVINSSAYLWTSTMPADFVVGVSYKCAIAYKSGSLAFYINGIQIGTSSATFTPSTIMNRFQLNQQLYSGKQSVIVRSAKLFTSRLSNDELVTLTIK